MGRTPKDLLLMSVVYCPESDNLALRSALTKAPLAHLDNDKPAGLSQPRLLQALRQQPWRFGHDVVYRHQDVSYLDPRRLTKAKARWAGETKQDERNRTRLVETSEGAGRKSKMGEDKYDYTCT